MLGIDVTGGEVGFSGEISGLGSAERGKSFSGGREGTGGITEGAGIGCDTASIIGALDSDSEGGDEVGGIIGAADERGKSFSGG